MLVYLYLTVTFVSVIPLNITCNVEITDVTRTILRSGCPCSRRWPAHDVIKRRITHQA